MKTQSFLLVASGLLSSSDAFSQRSYDGAGCTGNVVGMQSIRQNTCTRSEGGGSQQYLVSGTTLSLVTYSTPTCTAGTETSTGAVSTWDATTLCDVSTSAMVSTVDGYESCSMDGFTSKFYNSDDTTCAAADIFCQSYINGACPWVASATSNPILFTCNDASEFYYQIASWPTTESTCGGQALSTSSQYYRNCYNDVSRSVGEAITYQTTSCGDDDDDDDEDEDEVTIVMASLAFVFSFLSFCGVVGLCVKDRASAPMSEKSDSNAKL